MTYSTSEPVEAGLYLNFSPQGPSVAWHAAGYWCDAKFGEVLRPSGPFLGPLPTTADDALELALKVAFAEMVCEQYEEHCRSNIYNPLDSECRRLATRFFESERSPELLAEMNRVTKELAKQ